MLFWIYNALLLCSLPLLSLFFILKALLQHKRALSTYLAIPPIPTSCGPSFWIHAVSLGELNASKALIVALKKAYPSHKLYLSTVTETGLAQARKIKDLTCFYLPLDLWFLQKKLIEKIEPECVIYIEGDLWPTLSQLLKSKGIPQCIVSAKISRTSEQRLTRLPFLRAFLYGNIDLILCQDQIFYERFLKLNIDAKKLLIGGNLKRIPLQEDADPHLEPFLTLDKGKKTLVIACTHEGEEMLILDALQGLIPHLNLIIAPRHPARFVEVLKLLQEKNYTVKSYTQHTEGTIFFIDAIGLLKSVYKKTDLVILGGSFVQGIGGHNVMEPLFEGCPVLIGPYHEKQKTLVETMLQFKIGQVASLKTLPAQLCALLEDKELSKNLELFKAHSCGILDDNLNALKPLLTRKK